MGRNWQLVTNRKLIYHGFCSEDSSKLEEYGNVAEMAERSLCMREVRGSVPRISKTFWGFDNSMWCLLIMGRNWQLVTNRKLIYHGFCSQGTSKLKGYRDVAQMVERSLRMREVGDRCPASPKHFRGFDKSILIWLTIGKNWLPVTNRKLIYHEFCSQATSKLKGYGDVAQMLERSLRTREVGDRWPASPKHFRGFDKSILIWLTIGKNWLLVTNRKLIYHEFCSEVSSKLEEYGNVAEMAERSLCMGEVRGSMPRISKTFWGFDNSMWCLLIMGRNWQLVTNRQLIYHGFCSQGTSKLKGYRDVAQMVERSLRMRELGDRCPASPKHFRCFDISSLFWLTIGKDWLRVTNRKLMYHEFCSEASSKLEEYGNVAEMAERSLCMREVRGSVPRISKIFWGFDNSIWCLLIMGRNWQLVTNRKLIYHGFCSEDSSKLEGNGDVAQMVERLLCMREVRGSVPRISKTFWGFNNSMWCLLIMGRNWQLVTNRKLIDHEFCSEASSKVDEYGNVAEMAERSHCMREVRGSVPRISKTLRLRQFYLVFPDNGKELTTRYKSKADISWILFRR